MEVTFRDIQNMSDEEVRELNKKMALRVAKKFLMIHLIKWGLIIGVTQGLKKLANRLEE